MTADPGIVDLKHRITALAAAHRLPLFSSSVLIVEAGGLVSYGASVNKILRRTGYYVKKILEGANPTDLPIEQPTGLELIINLGQNAWYRNPRDATRPRRPGDRI